MVIPPAPKPPETARIAATTPVTTMMRNQARATSLAGGRLSALAGASRVHVDRSKPQR